MNKLLIATAIAGLVGTASLASANPAHHAGPAAGSVHSVRVTCGRHHPMHRKGQAMPCRHTGTMMQGAPGGHAMMDNSGMTNEQMQQHMQQMHGNMGGNMMGGGMMGGGQPTATPTPTAPK